MPLTIFNLGKVDQLYIGRDTMVTFAEEPTIDTYHIEVAGEEKIKEHQAKPCNWVPKRHETLPETSPDTAFICSPADVPGPRKVQLQDKDITTDIRQKFEELCEEHGEAFSKNNEDISRTKLVKMDIDTGDSPPVSSRPYTLPLKHYEWVQREIESLERAGVITKSMFKWASPIVIVPKKSAPGEPPKRRLCVDFRKVNELQQEVIRAGKTKGQIFIHPLPKIDEMYAKLKDISRPLTTLTKKDKKFKWTPVCQKSFDLLKETLCGEPVLKYADTSKPYTLYTDASKFGWAGVLTQSHTTVIDGKSTTTDHPVAFVSGLFRGSQLNWATLTKEAFAIYMSVKKLSFYLTDALILLRSDHKSLEKFLQKNTLNSKVNNWAMELEAFNIQFDYIKGSNNVLADTLSHLIVIDPDTPLTPEGQGYEFSYAIFEEFPEVKTNTYEVNKVIVGTKKETKNDPDLQDTLQCIENPITRQQLKRLQQQDANIETLKHKLQHNKLDKEYYSMDENGLLMRKVVDGGHEFCAIYLPNVLVRYSEQCMMT